jgi:vancomycin resistance protein YoaR
MRRATGRVGGVGRRRLLGFALATGLGAGGSLLPGLERLSLDLLAAAGPARADRLLAAAEAYLDAPQDVTLGEQVWTIGRRALGLSLTVTPAAEGRSALPLGQPPAVLTAAIDAAALERALAALPELDRPPVDARLALEGVAVTLIPDQPGRRLDRAALAAALIERASQLDDSPVALPLVEVPAARRAADLAPAADWLRQVLARPLLLAGTPGPAAIPPAALAAALRVEPTGSVRPDPAAWERLLAPLAASLAVTPVEPDLTFVAGRAEVTPPRPGQILDIPATADAAWRALQAGQTAVMPVLRPVAPRWTAGDLAPAITTARRLLARPPVLVVDDLEWRLTPADLARLLRGDGDGLAIDPTAAGDLLRAVEARVAVAPRRPLYRWRDERAVPEDAGRPGRRLDRAAALAALRDGLARGEARLVLPMVAQPVPAPPAALAFPDLLAEGRTYFADSSRERSTNVALGLRKIDGALVPPGGLFSFNQASGPVTLAAGFKKGYGIAISNGKVTTLPSIGGGICQVATTLFHAVFHAGLPVGERNWHLYWMPRYGRPPSGMTGLDATVDDQSGLDFTFFNTTGAWLLVEATAEDGYAVVRLWGTSPGWRVTVDGPVITNVVRASHQMIERPDPSLPKGTRVWVEHAEDGKRVLIRRTVRDDLGRLLERRAFVSHYAPASNVTLVGTGGA